MMAQKEPVLEENTPIGTMDLEELRELVDPDREDWLGIIVVKADAFEALLDIAVTAWRYRHRRDQQDPNGAGAALDDALARFRGWTP
jgi:hypothetical protein